MDDNNDGGWDDGWSGAFLQIESVSSVAYPQDDEIDIVMEDPRLLDFSDEESDKEMEATDTNFQNIKVASKQSSKLAIKDVDYEEVVINGSGSEIFRCKKCPYKSPKEEGISHHCKTAHSGDGYRCKKCPSTFSTSQHFAAHCRRHHPATSNLIQYQKQPTVSSEPKESGLSVVPSSNPTAVPIPPIKKEQTSTILKCKDCSFETKKRTLMRIHSRKAHSSTRTSYTCKQCPSVFPTSQHLAAHYRSKHPRLATIVPTEGIATPTPNEPEPIFISGDITSPGDVNNTILQGLFMDEQPFRVKGTRSAGWSYICNICDYNTKSLDDIQSHSRNHSFDNSLTKTKDAVPKTESQQLSKAPPLLRRRETGNVSTFGESTVNTEIIIPNTKESNKDLNVSNNNIMEMASTLTRENKITDPQLLADGIPPQKLAPSSQASKTPFKCHFCGMKIFSKYRFQIHLNSSHGKNNPVRCPLCDNFRFSGDRALRSHYDKFHTTEEVIKARSIVSASKSTVFYNHHSSPINDKKDGSNLAEKSDGLSPNTTNPTTQKEKDVAPPSEKTTNRNSKNSGKDDSLNIQGKNNRKDPLGNATIPSSTKPHEHIERRDRSTRDFMRFSCLRCFTDFSTSVELCQHYKKCVKTVESFPCSTCSDGAGPANNFSTLRNLKSHIWQDHVSAIEKSKILTERKKSLEKGPDSYPYKCLLCKLQLPDKRSFILHISTPHMYSCKECKFVTSIKAELRGHILLEHMKTEKKEEIKSSSDELPAYEVKPLVLEEPVTESTDSYESLICVLCGNVSSTVEEAKEHTRMIETESVICDMCGYVGPSSCELLLHLKTHSTAVN